MMCDRFTMHQQHTCVLSLPSQSQPVKDPWPHALACPAAQNLTLATALTKATNYSLHGANIFVSGGPHTAVLLVKSLFPSVSHKAMVNYRETL